MFPTKLELDVLQAERLRQAEKHRMLREIGTPSLFERIRARFSTMRATAPAQQESAPMRRTPCPEVATSNS